MNGKQAIQTALQGTQHMLTMFVGDLSDADLLVRPVPNANHIAWQIGHLISAERGLGKVLPGVAYPELPAGFEEQHNGKNAASDKGFGTKADYVNLFHKTREATLAALNKLSDADLDKPNTGSVAKFAPTLGALFILISNHVLMHTGQFTVVRRKLCKPVLM
jgi:hypothetical protein